MPSKKVTFQNSRGNKLAGLLDMPEKVPAPAVVLCHGFTGFKEAKPLPNIAKSLVEKGFVVLRFDFSDCIGESEGSCEDMKVSHQINDLAAALKFVEELKETNDNIGIVGHSLGAFTCIANAAVSSRMKCISALGCPVGADTQNWLSGEMLDKWEKEGTTAVKTFTKGHVNIDYSFFEDYKEYDLKRILPQIKVPIQFIHGTGDSIVPFSNAETLLEKANEPKRLVKIDGGGHLFLKDEEIAPTCKAIVEWCEKYLKGVKD